MWVRLSTYGELENAKLTVPHCFTIFTTLLPVGFRFLCNQPMNATRRIAFLINPISGTSAKEGLEQMLTGICSNEGLTYQVFYTARTTTADLLKMQLHDFGATDLVVCGGDGTVNLAASAVFQTGIHLGIIPVGSGNGLARTASIPLNPAKAFEVVLKGKLQPTDGFEVNGTFACMLSGIGLDAEVAERFSHSHRRGLITYTTQALIQFFKTQPVQFEVEIDGFRFFTDAFFISVANSNQFGNNVTIAPLASLSDGLLDVIIVQKMPKATLPFALLGQLRHNHHMKNWAEKIGKHCILYFQTPAITIGNPKHAPIHIDGDPYPAGDKVHYKIMPKAFDLWVPAGK
jgi:diacylglycerol kinase (ATP)